MTEQWSCREAFLHSWERSELMTTPVVSINTKYVFKRSHHPTHKIVEYPIYWSTAKDREWLKNEALAVLEKLFSLLGTVIIDDDPYCDPYCVHSHKVLYSYDQTMQVHKIVEYPISHRMFYLTSHYLIRDRWYKSSDGIFIDLKCPPSQCLFHQQGSVSDMSRK